MKLRYLLLVFSSFSIVAQESVVFPVSTYINRALLYDFTLSLSLSRENVNLIYNSNEKKFKDEVIYASIQSSIPDSSEETFTYAYSIEQFESSCKDKRNDEITHNSFLTLFVNGLEFKEGEKLPNFSFSNEKNNGFKNSLDDLKVSTNQNIENDRLLVCDGSLNLKVELYL